MMIGIDAAEDIGQFDQSGSTDHLRLGPVKVIIHAATGALNPPQDQLNDLVLSVHRNRLQLAFHVDEAETLEAAITALEHALSQAPRSDHRHRLEHCSVCLPHLMQRLKTTGAMVVTQPPFVYYSGERYLATVPPNDLKWLYAIGSLRTSGIRVAASSDAPVVHFNPFVGIYASVTRKAETGQTVLPRERISVADALESYTIDAAYASFEEDAKGSISPNKLADLVILSDDPTTLPPDRIRDTKVLTTILDGRVVWQK
jgi:predicted amidohydrolase YtcJ